LNEETVMTDDVRARVRGLGSRHSGRLHWLGQRLSALVLIGFVFWLLTIFPTVLGDGRSTAFVWLAQPWTAFFFALFLAALFYHLLRGLETVVEDYVPALGARFVALWVLRLGLGFVFAVDVFDLLRLVFAR
jgi:succinate dehydrogenase / fumarate reductase membrane anchor subunit